MIDNTGVNNSEIKKVPKRILTSLLSSVSAGVVPRAGAPYIAIGRNDNTRARAFAVLRFAGLRWTTKEEIEKWVDIHRIAIADIYFGFYVHNSLY